MKITPAVMIGRRAGALLLVLAASWFALIWLMSALGGDLVEHTVEHSRELYSDFKATAHHVDSMRADQGHLPDNDELAAWAERQLPRTSPPALIQPGRGQFGEEAVAELGWPPEGGYILGIWRGEWMEYYASWSGVATMPFDERAYYTFGSRWADFVISGLAVLFCLAGSFILWTRGPNRLWRPSDS